VHFEARCDPNVTNLLDHHTVISSDVCSFYYGDGEGDEGLTVAIDDSGIGDHPILDHCDVTVERPEIAGLPTRGHDRVGHDT
jgi:hypothetical protein